MPAENRDLTCLWDMREACREIREFTTDTGWNDFIGDRKLVLAIERCLEVIGEAANRVSEEFRQEHAGIAWHSIRGMRNLLAHEYGQIDHEIIYRTVIDEIPGLLQQLEELVGDE